MGPPGLAGEPGGETAHPRHPWACGGLGSSKQQKLQTCRPLQTCITPFHRGKLRPRALSKASPLTWATPPSQALVPAQPHRKQMCMGCQDQDPHPKA